MSKNIYRTSQGKEIDLGKLILKNEEVRAVGNMNVNARGDVVDSGNKKVQDRNKQVSKNYRKQIGNVVEDMPVVNSKKAAQLTAERYAASIQNRDPVTEVIGLDDDVAIVEAAPNDAAGKQEPQVEVQPVKQSASTVDETVNEAVQEAKGGLAEAIAKAREVKQEPLKTPQEEARSVDGVKKF